jgi:D-alanine transaminase
MTTNPHCLPDWPCYLNGKFTTLPHAHISVMDRGFIFGDGVYEVVPVYSGCPFRFDRHVARLDRSLHELRIDNPLNTTQWRELVATLAANSIASANYTAPSNRSIEQDLLIYIQITRGVALRDHAMTQGIPATVFAMATPMKPIAAEARSNGVACVTAKDFRWEKAHIKATSLLGAVFARQISVDADAVETVMFRGDHLSEAAASNVWVVKGGAVYGPPNDNLVLEGIRYGLIDELCQAAEIPFHLQAIRRDQVSNADELLLSSATKEVLAITVLDGRPVGDGRPGPVYHSLYAGYQRAKHASSQFRPSPS